MMNSAILDTNVFISGIFWTGPPSRILDAWKNQKFKLAISPDIFNEYIRVSDILSKKYNAINLTPFIDLVATYADFYSPIKLKEKISRDPDDDKFIACALSANCKVIVSGDKDLLDVSGYAGIEVLKPAEFMVRILPVCSRLTCK